MNANTLLYTGIGIFVNCRVLEKMGGKAEI